MAVSTDEIDFTRTGPDTLAGRYIRMYWQPVYRAQDLAPGRSAPVQIMNETFTLYRGEGGTPHAVAFRCAHRGTQLSTGWVEDDCLRCRYHGWKYDETGQCVEQPGEDETFAAKVRIRSYPTREYLGLIFVYFGEGEPAEFRRYPDFERPGVVNVFPPEAWPCNYFNRVDNACDLEHVAYTHRESLLRGNRGERLTVRPLTSVETEYGLRTISAGSGQRPQITHFHMPNTNQVQGEGGQLSGDRLFFRVPVTDESCISFGVELLLLTGDEAERYREGQREMLKMAVLSPNTVGDTILAGKERFSDVGHDQLTYRGSLFPIEDYVTQVGQGPIADRSANEHLGRVDTGVILLRRIWQRELLAFASGEPTKQWHTPAGLYDASAFLATAGS